MKNHSIAAILFASWLPVACLADPASDDQMALEAIGPYVPGDPARQKEVLRKQFEKLVDLAARAPDDVQPATVFFKTGLSYGELHDLRAGFEVEIIDVGLKAPQGDKGRIMSISSGMADLWAIDGTFEERLTFMITAEQRCFAKMAKHLPADEARGMAELATNPFFVYSARVFGSNRSLGELQQQTTVRGVLLNLRPGIIADFESATAVKHCQCMLKTRSSAESSLIAGRKLAGSRASQTL